MSTAAAATMEVAQELQPVNDQLTALGFEVPTLKLILAVLAVAGACFAIYARFKDRKTHGV